MDRTIYTTPELCIYKIGTAALLAMPTFMLAEKKADYRAPTSFGD